MRAPPSLYPLFVTGVVLACNESPSRPTALTAIGTPSFTALGSPPREVLMKTRSGTCLSVAAQGQHALTQTLTLPRESNLLLYFAFEWGSLNPDEEGLIAPTLDGPESPFEWSFAGNAFSRTSGTVMWSFANVPAGTHTVGPIARLEGGDLSAQLNECALTVFVVP